MEKRENMIWEVREKIIKKIKYKVAVIVYIYTVTVAKIKIYNVLNRLM